MFCTRCGIENDNDSSFCYACGESLKKLQPVQPVAVLQPVAVVQPVPEEDPTLQTAWQNRFMAAWRSSARSIFMLVITCLFTLLTIYDLKSAPTIISYMPEMIQYSEEYMMQCIGVLLRYVSLILVSIGLWVHYAEGWKKNKCRIGTAGITVIRVGLYLMLATTALSATATAMNLMEMTDAYYVEYMQIQMILWIIEFALLSFGIIVYAIVAGRIGTSARKSAAFSAEPQKLTSSAVLLFMMATLDLLHVFAPMILYAENYYDTEYIIYRLFIFTIYVLFGVLLLTHKSKLDTASKEPAENL